MITTVGGAVLITAVSVLAACAVVSQWRAVRAARAVIRRTQDEWDMPVTYWPEEALLLAALCNPCQDKQDKPGALTGECICAIQCGQPECLGGFSDADVEWLQGRATPEGTDQ